MSPTNFDQLERREREQLPDPGRPPLQMEYPDDPGVIHYFGKDNPPPEGTIRGNITIYKLFALRAADDLIKAQNARRKESRRLAYSTSEPDPVPEEPALPLVVPFVRAPPPPPVVDQAPPTPRPEPPPPPAQTSLEHLLAQPVGPVVLLDETTASGRRIVQHYIPRSQRVKPPEGFVSFHHPTPIRQTPMKTQAPEANYDEVFALERDDGEPMSLRLARIEPDPEFLTQIVFADLEGDPPSNLGAVRDLLWFRFFDGRRSRFRWTLVVNTEEMGSGTIQLAMDKVVLEVKAQERENAINAMRAANGQPAYPPGFLRAESGASQQLRPAGYVGLSLPGQAAPAPVALAGPGRASQDDIARAVQAAMIPFAEQMNAALAPLRQQLAAPPPAAVVAPLVIPAAVPAPVAPAVPGWVSKDEVALMLEAATRKAMEDTLKAVRDATVAVPPLAPAVPLTAAEQTMQAAKEIKANTRALAEVKTALGLPPDAEKKDEKDKDDKNDDEHFMTVGEGAEAVRIPHEFMKTHPKTSFMMLNAPIMGDVVTGLTKVIGVIFDDVKKTREDGVTLLERETRAITAKAQAEREMLRNEEIRQNQAIRQGTIDRQPTEATAAGIPDVRQDMAPPEPVAPPAPVAPHAVVVDDVSAVAASPDALVVTSGGGWSLPQPRSRRGTPHAA